jgi:hypothetical protein
MICYRIVEVKNGKLLSLFHGTQGSRVLPIGRWLKADKKRVHDGSCSTYYESGFHVLKSLEVTKQFFKKMFRNKKNRCIIQCEAIGLRKKTHSKSDIYLANRMKISNPTAI